MKNRIEIEQAQKLQQRFSPLQMQLGQILELTAPEMEEAVRIAVDENPALETIDKSSEDNDKGKIEHSEHDNKEYISYFPSGNGLPSRIENLSIDHLPSVYEWIMSQLEEYSVDEDTRLAAQYIAGSIDNNGYLTRTVAGISDDIAFLEGREISQTAVTKAMNIIRSMDPPGLGASDLREALVVQLERKKNLSADEKNALTILNNYFEIFSNKNFEKLKEFTGFSNNEIRGASEAISRLNPKPGRQFAASREEDSAVIVQPDFMVLPDENYDDSLRLTSLTDLPDLAIEKSFQDSEDNLDNLRLPEAIRKQRRETALFIKEKREEASNFINLVKMRNETLWRVMNAIVHIQKEFFQTGDKNRLRPMVLKDINAITGDDLSVISRATSGKYVLTQGGVFSLKSLFNEGTLTSDGGAISSHELELLLKQIIENEDKSTPLSDDEITRILNSKGVEIARRTVAKYREKLGVPIARLRKEL